MSKLINVILGLVLLSIAWLLYQTFLVAPTMIFAAILFALLLIVLLIFALAKAKSKVIKIIGIVFAVILMVIVNVGNYFFFQTKSSLNSLNSNKDTIKFNIITNKNSEFENIENIDCKVVILKMGDTSFNDQILIDLSKTAKNVKSMQLTDSVYDAHKLIEENLDTVLVINEEIENSLSLEANSFKNNSKVIHTLEYSKNMDVKPVDVNVSKESFVIFYNNYGLNQFNNLQQTNKLIVVNPNVKEALIINIPYQYYVKQPCQADKEDRLSNAKIFGTKCMIDSVEGLIGEKVNYFVLTKNTSGVNPEEALEMIKNDYMGYIDNLNSFVDTNMPSDDILSLVKLMTSDLIGWDVETYDLSGDSKKATLPSNNSNSIVIIPNENSVNEAKTLIQELKNK